MLTETNQQSRSDPKEMKSLASQLSDRDWRCGFSEAVKVSLVKDAEFFSWIEKGEAVRPQNGQ